MLRGIPMRLLAAISASFSVLAPWGCLHAQLLITELQSNQSSASIANDYWELTNLGSEPVELGGYKWDDSIANSNDPAAVTILGGTTIAPNESIIFTIATEADFRSWWSLPAGVQVISSSGPGFSASEMVGLFNPSGSLVASFVYGAGGFTKMDGTPSTGGHAGLSAGGTSAFQAAIWVPTSGAASPRYTFATGSNFGSRIILGRDSGSPGVTDALPQGSLDVSFTANVTSAGFGKTVTFTATAAGAVGAVNYLWEFGDGYTKEVSQPVTGHLYQHGGVFTVKVTATAANGTGSAARTGYIRIGGFSEDSDGDGLVDGLEYYFNLEGGDPNSLTNLPRLVSVETGTRFRFSRLANSDLSGTLETSTDLNSWTRAIVGLDYEIASSAANGGNIDFSYSLAGKGFYPVGHELDYRVPFTEKVGGASLGGLRVENMGMVGVGRIAAETLDQFGETLGGSSGLAISNWSYNGTAGFQGILHMLPDKGYNGSNYSARIHRVAFTFKPSPQRGGNGLGQVIPNYQGSTKFSYIHEGARKFTTGLNPYTNISLFGQLVGMTEAANGPGGALEMLLSFDAESLQLLPDGSGFVSDEYGAYIARFNPNQTITGITQLPESARPHSPVGTVNFSGEVTPLNGRRDNQGLEGISISPDKTRLFAMLQSAVVQDYTSGAQTRNHARLFVYDISGNRVDSPLLIGEYVVKLPRFQEFGNGSAVNKTANQSEIVAVGNQHFLMLPQDGNGLGSGTTSPGVYKTVQLVDFSSATNILGQYDAEGNSVSPGGVLRSTIKSAVSANVVNILDPSTHSAFGINTNNGSPDANTTPEKWEGMALVPDLSTERDDDFFLFVGNDNDFQSAQYRVLNPGGTVQNYGDNRAKTNNGKISNDAVFYVYRLIIGPEQERFYRLRVEAE